MLPTPKPITKTVSGLSIERSGTWASARMYRCASHDVDDIVTGGGHADVAEIRKSADMLARQDGFIGQGDGGAAGSFHDLVARCPVVDATRPEGFECGPGKIPGIQGVSVEHDDLDGRRT